MTTTLKAIRREMYQRAPTAIGRTVDIASLTTTTAVVTALGTGTVSAEKYKNKWLLRADAASAADRVRICTNFAASTGTFTHAGTNYADTTATSEKMEIIEYEPYLLDDAIQITLERLRRAYVVNVPCTQQYRHWLGDLSWVEKPEDVIKVDWSPSPVLTRNRYMELYSTVNTSGVLVPDFWTIAGASATMARSTTQVRRGSYSLAITRAGTDCTVSQTPGLLWNGVNADSLRGEVVTAVANVWSAVASQVRVRVSDGITTTNSSYHTGGSAWEELTAEHTISSTATTLTISISVETSNTVCYADDVFLMRYAVTDAARRDAYVWTEIPRNEWEQGGTLAAILPMIGNGVYRVTTRRPYPRFDADRVYAGTADADSTDAPLTTVATGAIARLFEGLALQQGTETSRYAAIAAEFNRRFEQLAAAHFAPPQVRPGLNLPFVGGPLAPASWRP